MNRDFKGVWIPKEIWLHEELTMIEKVLLVEIHSLDNENGCFASNEYFAEFLGCSMSAVTKGIRKLKGLGYVEQKSFDGRKRVLSVSMVKFTMQSGKIDEYTNTVNNTDTTDVVSKQQPKYVLFKNSIYYYDGDDIVKRTEAKQLFKDTILEVVQAKPYEDSIDYGEYWETMASWSNGVSKSGKEVKRKNSGWRDTIKTWIRRDIKNGQLKVKGGV